MKSLFRLLIGSVLLVSAPAVADTVTFVNPGCNQTFAVPAGVSAISVTAAGSKGGGSAGGEGTQLTATAPVTPGATLHLCVREGAGAGGGEGAGAGLPGGGYASVGLSAGSPFLVAAGGGGASGAGIAGGAAGAPTGSGADGTVNAEAGAGAGATDSAGGTGGINTADASANGVAGAANLGGSGGVRGGGGGGGGVFGGGGGAGGLSGGAGGGGGSSLCTVAGGCSVSSFSGESFVSLTWTVAATAPGAPTDVVASRGDGQVSLSWTAPASNGGAAITQYTAVASPGGATCSSATTGCTVTGLSNGTAYTFTVTAKNASGTGPASSPSAAVTPARAPDAPTAVGGTAGNGQVTVFWSAPASTGGEAITGYTVTASPGGASCSTATRSCVVTGLVNLTAYTFAVTATNAAGTSAPSAPSSPVTPSIELMITTQPPTLPPGATLTFAAMGGSGTGYQWSVLTNNSGSNITSAGLYTAGPTPNVIDVVRVVDSLANSKTVIVTVASGVKISPATPSVAPGGSVVFTASGGSGFGYQWSLTASPSGGTIHSTAGAYVAGTTPATVDTVRVVDSLGNSASVNVSVGAGLALNPAEPSAPPRGTVQFAATGGTGTYTFTLAMNASGATLSSAGLYVAGATGGVQDIIKVSDSHGASVNATVKVGPQLSITPPEATVRPRQKLQLAAAGGSGAEYKWSLAKDDTGATVDATGLYVASTTLGKDVIRVTDSLGNSATVEITVADPVSSGCSSVGAGGQWVWLALAALGLLTPRKRRA